MSWQLENWVFESDKPDAELKLIDFGLSTYFSKVKNESRVRPWQCGGGSGRRAAAGGRRVASKTHHHRAVVLFLLRARPRPLTRSDESKKPGRCA